MTTRRSLWTLLAALPALALGHGRRAQAQIVPNVQPPASGPPFLTGGPGESMLTIFLRHDQTQPVGQINEKMKKSGFYHHFPPPGVQIISWYELMGIGHVITVRFPAEKLRDINRVIEADAWGGFESEFYPTYDFLPVLPQLRQIL